MNSARYLGIDVGTSKLKLCLFDHSGRMIRELVEDTKIIRTPEAYFEIDAQGLFDLLLELIPRLAGEDLNKIVSLSFSVSSPTVVLVDKNLDPVMGGILYLDNRSDELVEEFADGLGGRLEFFKRTGNNPSHSTCAAALIKWAEKYNKSVFQRIDKFLFLNSFLAAKLTGNAFVEPTIASYSGLVDVKDPYKWNLGMIDSLGIDKAMLPEIVTPFHNCGTIKSPIAEKLGLNKEVKVILGCADTAASSFGIGINKEGQVFESLGTSSVLTICHNKPNFDMAFMNRAHVIPGLWLSHGAMSTTGGAINWFMESVLDSNYDHDQVEALAQKSQTGAGGVIFLPYLSGERSPIFDSKARGLFFGLTMDTDKKDLVRSIYESSAFGSYQLYQVAKKTWDLDIQSIKCVGGASKSSLALQIRADLFGLEFYTMETANSSAFGAAMIGAIGAGYHDLESVPYTREILEIYRPTDEGEKLKTNFNIYKELYPKLKDLMHLL